jgi:predicted ribosomally synthesized peptide with SipW-like signal peptide
MKKKIILLCTAAAMVAVLAVGGTLAYLQDTDTAENTFMIGSVLGALTENGDNTTDPGYVDWDNDEEAQNILPGQTFQKRPVVTNTGKNDAYVRLRVTGADVGETLTETHPAYFRIMGLNENDWTYDASDECYYYNSVLLPADDEETTNIEENKTKPLFTHVQLKPNVTEIQFPPEQANTHSIFVYAELIQADYLGGSATRPNSAKEAFAYYDER